MRHVVLIWLMRQVAKVWRNVYNTDKWLGILGWAPRVPS